MAANSNMGFHHGLIPASAFNRHAIAFQSGAVNSSTGMISVGNYGGMNNMVGTIPDGNSGGASNMGGVVVPGGSSAGGFLLETVPGLKHDTGLAVDWSPEEQSILEDGLLRHANESSIMRYIKIASALQHKTVRDVALRCRWMTKKDNGKRRKPEDHYMGKKMKDRKEKLVDSSTKPNVPPSPQPSMPAYSFMLQHMNRNDLTSCGVPAVSGMTRHLLDENAQVFGQISANLGAFKIQDNIDLFCRTRNNLIAILNDMRDMPGIMSHMPPLQVSINEELASTILPGTVQASSQALMFGSSGSIELKQEPRC
ncbi:uncharacterized protein LOC131236897 [Magnolia sinica]|uniref:uncharacterized protein LOC131236897 n=1 Tax=Magnolia sinica TaxID=86752 RepID=UPI00265ADCF0|nr:uncharacterized protein LOC131236897 [Magnolia sinica]XP_058090405.1 uncharacterized protein LOC131236897 [Magnolia sinica]